MKQKAFWSFLKGFRFPNESAPLKGAQLTTWWDDIFQQKVESTSSEVLKWLKKPWKTFKIESINVNLGLFKVGILDKTAADGIFIPHIHVEIKP